MSHSLAQLLEDLRFGFTAPSAGSCSSLGVGSASMPGAFFSFSGAGRFARASALLARLRQFPHWLAVAVLVAPGVVLVGVAASQVVLFAWPHWSAWSVGSVGFVRFGRGGGQPRPGSVR